MVVLKGLNLDSLNSMGYGNLERLVSNSFLFGGCGGLEKLIADNIQFGGVVVFKELIF